MSQSFGDVRYSKVDLFGKGITEKYSVKYGDAMLEPI